MNSPIRLDSWLHAARFYKTRSLAAAAVDGGKVELNGQRAKRGKAVRPGDQLVIRQGPREYRITVLALSQKRGSASVAATLYSEDPASRAARERAAELHRLAAQLAGTPQKGRPTKRDRRALERLREPTDP